MCKAQILVVEDENVVSRDIQTRLQRLGYDVPAVVSSGEEAVEKAGEIRPDLVLMDIMLKGEMVGTEAAEQIRERFDLPVIYLTAYADDLTLQQAKVTEPFGYILKPFEERDLRTTLEMALYRHRMERKLKEAEEELENQRMLSMRADRLRSLGEMAAGISHELNQPLVGVRGLAEHILIAMDKGWELTEEKIRDRVTRIVEQADRMVHIIQHVRMFAREAGKFDRVPVQVNDVVRSAMDMVGAQFRSHGLELSSELAEGLPLVSANPFSLEEVLLNLLNNSRDALEEKMKEDEAAPAGVLLRTEVNGGGPEPRVKVEVIDQGGGIPQEALDKVFDPFFTIKSPEKGTGLGLGIARSIVEAFDGTLQIRSTPGQGTTGIVSLPVGPPPDLGDL